MTESKIKRLWKNRVSQHLAGFNISSCVSPSISSRVEEKPPEYSQVVSHTQKKTDNKKLWRKPLPDDCPAFDSNNEIQETLPVEKSYSLAEKTEIPTRHDSRFYAKIPTLEAQLDRACKNEKAILLTKLLSKQQYQHHPKQ